MLRRMKADNPQKEDATVLMELDIKYDYLIQVMDTVRGAKVAERGSFYRLPGAMLPDVVIRNGQSHA